MLKKKNIIRILTTTLSVFVIFILYKFLSLENSIKIFKSINITVIIGFSLLSLISLLLRTYRLKILIRSAKDSIDPTILDLLFATALRNFLMDFIPFRLAEGGIVAFLKTRGVKVTQSASAVAFGIILDFIVLATLLLPVLIYFYKTFSAHFPQIDLVLIFLILFTAIGFFILYNFSKSESQASAENQDTGVSSKFSLKALKIKRDFIEELKEVTSSQIYKGIFITLLLRVTKYLSLTILFIDLIPEIINLETTVSYLLISPICFVIAEGFSSLPGSGVLGFGGYELSFTYCFSIFFGSVMDVTSTIFVVHIVNQLVSLTIGLLILSIWPFIKKKI